MIQRDAYDPARHDNQIVALFDHRLVADEAVAALLAAGLTTDGVVLLTSGQEMELFAPEEDVRDLRLAMARGHEVVVIMPTTVADRESAFAVLDTMRVVDLEERRAAWTVEERSMNRATVSRADLAGKTLPGAETIMLDMTGKPMRVRTLTGNDMQAIAELSPDDPRLHPQSPSTFYNTRSMQSGVHEPDSLVERATHGPRPTAAGGIGAAAGTVPPAPTASQRRLPTSQSATGSYTYGVPAEIASRLSPEQQIAVQMPVRLHEAPARGGWRESHDRNPPIRSYLADRGDVFRPSDRVV